MRSQTIGSRQTILECNELRDIPRHPPQMGETEITLCGGVPFNHGEPLQTFLRIENRRRSFTAALREPEFLEISN